MAYKLTSPCSKCRFRNDIPAYLTPARVRKIQQSLIRAEFPCHETVDYSDEDENGEPSRYQPNAQHCAGALILL